MESVNASQITAPERDDLKANQRAVLAIVLISYVMIVLDISIVITALPKIETGLGFSHTGLSWVSNAYTLAFGGMLLFGARLGDIWGRRRMLIIGLALFSAASFAIGAALSPEWLVIARAVQGVGSAVLAPSTLALLSTNFAEGPERTRALSLYGAAAGVGATVGLVLGGVIADWLSWRVGFFMNVPIGIALMFAAKRYLSETPRQRGSVDAVGAICSTLGMTALVYGIVRSAGHGWTETITLTSLIAAVLLLTAFVYAEGRVSYPLMPLRLLASFDRSVAYAARMLFVGSSVGFFFFSTQYLQGVMGYSPMRAGLAFLPCTLFNFCAAMQVPRVSRRIGNGPLLIFALCVSLLGSVLLSQVSVETTYWIGVALPMALVGIGQGFALSPLTVAGVAGVPAKDAGAASGVVNVAHQIGGSLGLGILVVMFDAANDLALEQRALLAHRIDATFLGASALLLIAVVLVVLQVVRSRSRAPKESPALKG